MTNTTGNVRRIAIAIVFAAVAGAVLAGCSNGNIFTVKVGDCFNGDIIGEVSAVSIVDCSKPHEQEAYARIVIAEGPYPGEDAVVSQADDECFAKFDSFVGIAYDDSIYDYSFLYPLEESWAAGDREILCVISDPAGMIGSGSLAGAAR